MDKEHTLAFVKQQLDAQIITRGDLLEIASEPHEKKEATSKNIVNVFYAIGAIIAFIGIAILIGENWNEIGIGGRLLVSLGVSLATYVAGMLMQKPDQHRLSQVMFTLSAALAPLASYVLLDTMGVKFTTGMQIVVSALLAAIYGYALFIVRKPILSLITIAYASWAYFAFADMVFGNGFEVGYLKWATMLAGISYLLIGYGYPSHSSEHRAVSRLLYGVGTLAFLGAAITVGGFFDLIFIGLVFGAFYGSVFLKSRAMLIFGALFLTAHIIKLTSKYFADSLSWPIALIGVGFLVIGIGYGTLYLNKKYLNA